MNIKSISVFALSLALLSCAPMEEEQSVFNSYEAPRPSSPTMGLSNSMGVNVEMLDKDLADLVGEAQTVEMQVAVMLKKLSDIRMEISNYKQMPDIGFDDVANMNAIPIEDVIAQEIDVAPVIAARPNTVTTLEQPDPDAELQVVTIKAPLSYDDVQPASQPMVVDSTELKAPPQLQATPKQPSPILANGVTNIRTGIHYDKTRLVFDINGSLDHSMDFDRDAGLLTIAMPNTKWATNTKGTFKLTQVNGFDAKPTGQGTMIAMDVKNTSDVKIQKIKAMGNKPARLIIDLIK